MWKQLLSRLNVVMAPCVERRYIAAKGCLGLVCKEEDGVKEGEVLALVPYLACTSPIMALASPWGTILGNALSSYSLQDEGVTVLYAKEAACTTAFTALAMQPRSPLEGYLRAIEIDEGDDPTLNAALGAERMAKMQKIDALNADVVAQMHKDLERHGIRVSFSDLLRAHRICASRCVDVPFSEEILGGPALVPFVDLINHDSAESNTAVYMESTDHLTSLLRHHSRFNAMDDRIKVTQFCVVVRAAREVLGGAEFVYPYVDPVEDPSLHADKLYWASRFRFVPSNVA